MKNYINSTNFHLQILDNFVKNFFENKTSNDSLKITNKSLERICVSRPYFAFTDIYLINDEYLIAPLMPQQNNGNEECLISIGESGRHMAILGSCSAGIKTEEKNYYLVEDANISNLLNYSDYQNIKNNNDIIFVGAKLIELEKRFARAETIIFDKNLQELYFMSVSYKKLSPALFQKFFIHKFTENLYYDTKENPYKNYLPLQKTANTCFTKNYMEFSLNSIEKEKCFGHFNNCPAIPTAFLIYNIIHFASNAYLEAFGGNKFEVLESKIKLLELLFPSGEKIIRINYFVDKDKILFNAKIEFNNVVNNQIEFLIRTR